jgi:hypothetical protein
MKIYKEKTTTVAQKKIEVAYRLVEDGDNGRIDLETVEAETGRHINWLATLTTRGIHIHEFSEPNKDDYNYDEDMFYNNQLNVEYDRGINQ